jgi:hypothetical protein
MTTVSNPTLERIIAGFIDWNEHFAIVYGLDGKRYFVNRFRNNSTDLYCAAEELYDMGWHWGTSTAYGTGLHAPADRANTHFIAHE